ncbi:hypothetical protein AGMMS49546_38860 [Spirochaetia bacterium]|nr:hypothetical protein AGMMS49546_38860 [Spirochaetia bacterium]
MYKVLFVDDEPWVIIDIMRNIPWKELGFDVIGYYEKAREALDAIIAEKPHLVFVDINMPAMSGFELIRRCREADSFSEFIILSAYSDFEFAKEAIRAAVLDYCLKPVNPTAMINMLKDIKIRFDKKEIIADIAHETAYISEGESRFNCILSYVKTHYNTKVLLQVLSEEFFYNKNYICHLFKKYTGNTFSNYLVNLRIEKSKELLEFGDMPMQIIAEKTGFMDCNYFNKVFKTICGIPPHKYRVQAKQRQEINEP